VDLVYLDPPFNSNATYNVLFGDHGKRAPAQIAAFEDTWHWDDAASAAFDDALAHGGKVADAMKASSRSPSSPPDRSCLYAPLLEALVRRTVPAKYGREE
jgi:hypothetical protein